MLSEGWRSRSGTAPWASGPVCLLGEGQHPRGPLQNPQQALASLPVTLEPQAEELCLCSKHFHFSSATVPKEGSAEYQAFQAPRVASWALPLTLLPGTSADADNTESVVTTCSSWKPLLPLILSLVPLLSVHGILQAKNTGVGCHFLLQGIFPTQGLNPGLLHCRWILYQLSHKGNPRMLQWVAYPFSSVIFLTQESNWSLLYCRRILNQLSYQDRKSVV